MSEILTAETLDKLWNFGDPAASEAKFREAIANGAGDEGKTQLARSLGLQRKFDDAQAVLDSISLDSASAIVQVRHALESGRVRNSSGRKEEAIPYFESALKLAEAADLEFYAIDAAHMLGIACEGEAGLDWNLRAIAMADAAKTDRARNWLGSLLNNTAWSMHDLGRFEEALDLFQKAAEFREQQGNAETIHIAHWAVGRCLRSLGRHEEALAIQRRILDGDQWGFAYEEIAENLAAQDQMEAATPWFAQAYERLVQIDWVAEDTERIGRLATLGGVNLTS